MKKITINTIKKRKAEGAKITALTAYDYATAKAIDETGIDIILVGDSLAMVAQGQKDTLPVTVEEMLYHTKIVSRGAKTSLIVADMPFMSYQADIKDALVNAGRFFKEAGAQAVKVEGCNGHIINVVKRLIECGIPVLGHLGFTPQFLYTIGGYNVQGKTDEATELIKQQAKELEQAGVFAIVLEMVPEQAAKTIKEAVNVPTIGIGAGVHCDGQILVSDDIIGKYPDFTPKFARKYADVYSIIKDAVNNYKNDVINEQFPGKDESF